MNAQIRNSILLFIAAVLSVSQTNLQAAGFRLASHDGFATSRGEAFAATADNPSAIYYNPAGITQLQGHNVRAGLYAISIGTSYDSPMGGHSDTRDTIHVAPHLYYTYTPDKLPLAFGLGIYAPFGLGVEWPEDTGFRSIALEAQMSYMTINPVLAWRVVKTLSIAAGPTFNYSETELSQGVTPFPNNDEFRFKGDAVDYGFNAAILWQPHPKISLGATYRSQTTMDYDGSTKTSFATPTPGFPLKLDAQAELAFPQSVVAGISYRPTPKWNIEFNADWTDWNRVNELRIRQAVPLPTTVLNWESSFYYELGVTRYFDNGWHLNAGYIFNENCVPEATFNPLVPDMNRHFFCVGLGLRGKHFGFDAGYQFGYGPKRTVEGSPINTSTGQTADGRYESTSHALAATVNWHF